MRLKAGNALSSELLRRDHGHLRVRFLCGRKVATFRVLLRGARSALRSPLGFLSAAERRSTNAIMMCAEVWFEAGERIRTRRALTP